MVCKRVWEVIAKRCAKINKENLDNKVYKNSSSDQAMNDADLLKLANWR